MVSVSYILRTFLSNTVCSQWMAGASDKLFSAATRGSLCLLTLRRGKKNRERNERGGHTEETGMVIGKEGPNEIR